ncbi:uncharacterized protein LOC104884372 isoform X5 [Beta vulgaris subsp. vulgaris]|uniref:uncharacterized protein LOC104884372 isoform X5 n=1 Tax=Beta vulgaris subsp. vulgaris TaxID=3555 RepID=UPI002036A311|nr:uncharacterized protein LOC104884372 isoform X5 [Beta vulgaris subsp. vulgaris]
MDGLTPTIREYYHNMWKLHSEATFLFNTQTEDGRQALILESTIFHPQGGGQPSDTGFITNLSFPSKFVVEDVRCKDGIIYHFGHVENSEGNSLEWKVERESKVELHVDEARRDLNSRPYVEYKGTIPQAECQIKLEELERDANAQISRGGKVSAAILPYEQAAEICGGQLPDYIPKDSRPRIIKLGENLGCPCGGTHVRDISEIRNMKDYEPHFLRKQNSWHLHFLQLFLSNKELKDPLRSSLRFHSRP